MKRSKVVLAAALLAMLNLAPLHAAATGPADQASSPVAAAAPAQEKNKTPTVVGSAVSPKDKSKPRKPRAGRPTPPVPKPPPPESAVRPIDRALAPNRCAATGLTSCISERIADEVQCNAACAARLRKSLADLGPALAKPDMQGADRELVERTQRCLGAGAGLKPDDAACAQLLAVKRARQPQANSAILPEPGRQSLKPSTHVSLEAKDWAQLGLLFVNLLISAFILMLLGRRRSLIFSQASEADSIERSAGVNAPELDLNDSSQNVPEDSDGLIGDVPSAPAQNPPLGVEEPGESFDGDYPEEGLSDLRSAQRIDQDNFSELTEIKRQHREHLVVRGLGVPEAVLELFSMIQLIHRNLDYDKVPPEDFQEQLSGAVSKIAPEYRLFWEEGAAPSLIAEDWYETINQEGWGNGSPWLSRVDTPGLKRDGRPVIRAKIHVKFGLKPRA